MSEGLITQPSEFDPKETMDRLAAAVTRRATLPVLARASTTRAATSVGLTLRPTEVLIFGNPRAGTPLMQAAQTMGIDLPLKALVWRDAEGRTWLQLATDPASLARAATAPRPGTSRPCAR